MKKFLKIKKSYLSSKISPSHIHILFFILLCFCLLFMSGCLTMEQEIFLKDDGSGTFVIHITIPNPPGEVKKPEDDPGKIFEDMKTSIEKLNIKGITLKETKMIDKNDLAQVYIVFEFEDIKTFVPVLKQLYESGGQKSSEQEEVDLTWTADLKKEENKNIFSSSFSFVLEPKQEEKKETTKEDAEFEKMMEDMMRTMLATGKIRFVIHAPKDFIKTNADITFGNQAVWEAALSMFLDKGKRLEIEAIY